MGAETQTPRAQLDGFIDKYSPEVARLTRQTVAAMRKRLPAANVLVYDNYNALAIGFGPTTSSSDIVFSIAAYPRWVSLFFAKGKGLRDPHKRLKGAGNVVRHVVLGGAEDLEAPAIRMLMQAALEKAGTSLRAGKRGQLIIKSISAKQRPRRPRA
jgi:hypothetical protein